MAGGNLASHSCQDLAFIRFPLLILNPAISCKPTGPPIPSGPPKVTAQIPPIGGHASFPIEQNGCRGGGGGGGGEYAALLG